MHSHQQWLAWFTVGNRLSNGVVLKYFEADDIVASFTLQRVVVGVLTTLFLVSWFSSVLGLGFAPVGRGGTI